MLLSAHSSIAMAGAVALAVLCLSPAPAVAQAAAVKAPAVRVETAPSAGEPVVTRTVIEDDNARIEELRVRGAVRSTKVQPKGPIKAEYEVAPADAGRDISSGAGSERGVAGQSLWRVLSF